MTRPISLVEEFVKGKVLDSTNSDERAKLVGVGKFLRDSQRQNHPLWGPLGCFRIAPKPNFPRRFVPQQWKDLLVCSISL